MASLVREWGGGLVGSAADPQPISIPATIPAGHTLVLSLAVIQATEAASTVSDTAGNTWQVVAYESSGASTTRHIVAAAKITSELTSSDTISVDLGSAMTRFAWCVTEWDALLGVADSHFDDPANSGNVNSTAISCPDDSLLLSCVVLRNPGRTVTAVAPTQITTKYMSLAESGDRATWQQYRTVTTAATVSTESTLNSSGGFSLYSLVLVPASEEEATGSVIVGGAKKPIVSRSVIIGGEKKPVTGIWVIVGGEKKPIGLSGLLAPPPSSMALDGVWFGACPAYPGGATLADAQTVITKWGPGAAIRQFHTPLTAPHHPALASRVHSSYKPPVNAVISGALDDEIAAVAEATPAGDVIEIWHEPDKKILDGVYDSASTLLTVENLVAAKNHFYEVVKATNPDVWVANTLTGAAFSNYGGDREEPWGAAKADLAGVDLDGVHDTSPPLNIEYDDELAGILSFVSRYASSGYIGITVPEFGTSRPAYDSTGELRAEWTERQIDRVIAADAYMCCLYDYESTPGNEYLLDTPEGDLWASYVASNAWP